MTELKRVIGTGTILALSIGSVIGTGIFLGPAIGAGIAGNASIIAWILLSLVGLYIAACFGELVAMFPKAGGVYEFGKQTYGRFSSFIIGWVAWLVGNITTVVLIVAGVEYLLPGKYAVLKIIISIVFLFVLNLIALLGMKESSFMVMTFSIISVLVVLGVLLPGFFSINTDNYTPFFSGGITPIFVTLFFIAESFFGWEAATYLAEETKNPEKVIPKALILSTVIVALMGVLLAVTMLGVIKWDTLAQSAAPLRDFSQIVFKNLGVTNLNRVMDIISLGVYLTLLGSASGNIITMPRLLLALARDKLFLKQFTAIHPKFFTPHKAITFQFFACLIILFIGFGTYKTLLSLLVPLGLIMYATVLLSIPLLRFKKPDLKREFKVPFGKIGPVLVVLFFIAMVVMWAITQQDSMRILGLGGSLVMIGIPLYLLIELYNDPEMITEVNDVLAYLTLFTERINLPRSVQKEIFSLMGDIRGKFVLEFGCGVGTLTSQLARSVGPTGIVYATSFSKNHLKITKKRTTRKYWDSQETLFADVRYIHDLEHTSRVHPNVGRVDVAVSVGTIGYLQEVEKVLKEINELMPQTGRIVFVDYGEFFHMIPNVDWLSSNKKIERVFRNCGFSVQVERKKGLFWNYIFIYGMKFGEDVPFI
ncbi:MAG: 2-phytyl-1,4-naphtoquinone methyltransferase [Candidatus Woesearchaeota archaeon]|nr:2-phytyl-1,4-naphtoquinone methyltransferase [Candidatus Woesearchaeota archaeon]